MKSSFGSFLFVIDQLVFGGICGITGGVLCDDGGVIIVSCLMVLDVFGVGGVPDSGSLRGSNGATFAGGVL